jgi:hypothetical protein
MAEKKVTVVIDGEEHVSEAANSAEAGLSAFGKRIPFVVDLAKMLELGLQALSAAFQYAKDFAMDSIRAYDEYAASNQRLSAQSKLTGVSIGDLEKAAKRGREEFNLGIAVANDAAVTTAKYASRAGDATKQNELLAAALNLGAASGLNAADSMQALEMGLRGQDEGFDKLLGKNPSTIWKEYADANDLAVGKMTDTQKRMAELTAVVDAGNKVGNVYNERLQTGAGQQEVMNNKLENAKIAFGAAIQPVRILIVQGLSKLIDVATPVVLAMGKVATFLFEVFVGSFKMAQSAVGGVVEVIGRLTGNKALEEWGKKQSQAMNEYIADLDKMEGKTKTATTAVEGHGKAHELAAVKITASAGEVKKATEITSESADAYFDKASKKLGKPLAELIDITTTSIDRLAETGRDQLDPKNAEAFAKQMGFLRAEADKGNEAIFNIGKSAQSSRADIAGIAGSVGTIARGAIDAAVAFKVMDDATARTLASVINIATSIAKFAGSGGTDMASLVSAMASWVSLTMQMLNAFTGNDPARRKLIGDNTVALDRLRTEMGNLSLNVTGETFAKVQDALGSVMGQIKSGRGSRNESDVLSALMARGLSMNDLQKVADALGIKIRSTSGALSIDGLKQLFEAMGLVELGAFGTDFASQLQATTTGFGINKTNDLGQIGALGQLGGQFSSALAGVVNINDLAGSRAKLKALFERMNAGGLTAAELGGLTGSQFLDLITNIIGRIDNLAPGGTGTVSGGGITLPTGTVTSTSTASEVSAVSLLTSHSAFHQRTADATEGSFAELKKVNENLSTLIALTGGADGVDKALEQQRYALAVQQGVGASF